MAPIGGVRSKECHRSVDCRRGRGIASSGWCVPSGLLPYLPQCRPPSTYAAIYEMGRIETEWPAHAAEIALDADIEGDCLLPVPAYYALQPLAEHLAISWPVAVQSKVE